MDGVWGASPLRVWGAGVTPAVASHTHIHNVSENLPVRPALRGAAAVLGGGGVAALGVCASEPPFPVVHRKGSGQMAF